MKLAELQEQYIKLNECFYMSSLFLMILSINIYIFITNQTHSTHFIHLRPNL